MSKGEAMKGGTKGYRERGKLQERYSEEDTGQYTAHKTHNAALALETLVLQMKIGNGNKYKLCIVMRHNVST